jgi:1-deoxy-D-xylulose-5-phosphate synthase
MLTGRRAALETIRRKDGLVPFTSRDESPYDAFASGHAGSAISAAAGMAAAARLKGERRRVVAVIGDGGLTAGMAYEALNHAGALGLDLLVVLNDNDMSISENLGALRDHAARLLAARGIDAPHARRPAAPARHEVAAGALFETLGFSYHGPLDGHDLDALCGAFDRLKDTPGPQLLHLVTVKGKGFAPAESDPIGYHGVTRFDPVTGTLPEAAAAPSYSQVFGEWLCQAAQQNPRVVAITPAMREGSGLVEFARRFPDRYHDVAIAEQHAVTLAAGLACEGLRPVLAIYSTFLQRGYDQLIHDVALQKLPVLLAIDRAGLVGADGATHQGAYDLSYLRCIPNLLVMAPSDENECRRLLATGLAHDGPSAVRYPRGGGPGAAIEAGGLPLAIGQGRLLRQGGGRRRPRLAILAFGAPLQAALEAAEILDASVADMRFVKPLDEALVLQLAASHELLVTVEDNAVAGGAGSGVNELLATRQQAMAVLNLGLPDRFVEHASRAEQLAACGLDSAGILRQIQKRLRAREVNMQDSQRNSLQGS